MDVNESKTKFMVVKGFNEDQCKLTLAPFYVGVTFTVMRSRKLPKEEKVKCSVKK